MKKLALALSLGVIVACGGGGKPTLIDSSIDAFTLCNPVAQTGCATGEKCTWIIDIDGSATTNPVGHLGCAPNGTVADNGTCQFARAGMNGGVDACVAGELCLSGKCKPICDPQVTGAAAGACPTDYACSTIDGLLESGGDSVAGICESACDPLTQRLKVGGAEACGSVAPATPDRTCVPGGLTVFSCADNVSDAKDREAPLMANGRLFTNSCAPGFVLGFFESSGSMTTLCAGLCAPLEVDADTIKVAGHELDNQGDAAVLGKKPDDPAPVAGHATCAAGVKGALTGINAPHGEDCRFLWAVTRDEDIVPTNPYNDTLGLCFPYEKFTFTVSGATFTEKSCAELPRVQPDAMDPWGTAAENRCYKFGKTTPGATAVSATAQRRNTFRSSSFRLAHSQAPLVRHIFE